MAEWLISSPTDNETSSEQPKNNNKMETGSTRVDVGNPSQHSGSSNSTLASKSSGSLAAAKSSGCDEGNDGSKGEERNDGSKGEGKAGGNGEEYKQGDEDEEREDDENNDSSVTSGLEEEWISGWYGSVCRTGNSGNEALSSIK